MSEKEELGEYGNGIVNTLEALLIETAHTTTQTDVLLAAFDSHRIPDEMVHRARERLDDDKIDKDDGEELVFDGHTAVKGPAFFSGAENDYER